MRCRHVEVARSPLTFLTALFSTSPGPWVPGCPRIPQGPPAPVDLQVLSLQRTEHRARAPLRKAQGKSWRIPSTLRSRSVA
eukprot:scaffold159485_cov29-Tisochrysis_lutea.AAC.4